MSGLDIAFVSSHHPSEESMGSSHVVSFLGRELARRGHRVRVYYPQRRGIPVGPTEWKGVEAIRVDGGHLDRLPFGPELGFSRNVARQLANDLDVVVVNNEQGGAPVIMRARQLQRSNHGKKPLTVDVLHGLSLRILEVGKGLRPRAVRPRVGYYVDYACLRWLEGYGATSADLCVAPSAAVREELLRIYRLQPARVQVIYNGVDQRRLRTAEDQRRARESLSLDPSSLYLLFIARDAYRKGLDVARATVARLRSEGLPVVLLNVGNREPSSPGVVSMGSVSPEMKERLLLACDAFFLPTRYEGYPVVIQEAASLGIPVVTTPSANVEIGTAGKDYLSVFPNTPEAHARALREILTDRGRREEMGRDGWHAQARRTYERQATEYLELFERGLRGDFYPVPYRPIPYHWTVGPSSTEGTSSPAERSASSPTPRPVPAPALPAAPSATLTPSPPVSPAPSPASPASPAGHAPYISVVILAWKRRTYVRKAVESVLRTSFPRDDLEVLVIKGFEDEELDRWLASQDVRVAFCPEDPSGPKHALGIELARGEVICWLDDDDEFTPEKLPAVASLFRSREDLAFFHHAHEKMDLSGNDLGPGNYIPDFNCSSVAVRRKNADGLRMGLIEINGICDTLQFYEMMALGHPIHQDPNLRLTRYRVSPTPNTNFDLLPSYAALARQIKGLGTGDPHRRALAHVLRIYFSTLVRTPCDRRAEAAELLTLGLGTRNIQPFLPDLREVVCGSLHPFSPEISRSLYTFLRRGRVDWLTPHPAGKPTTLAPQAH